MNEARVNAQCRLAARPVGLPTSSNWDYVEEPAPEAGEGQVLIQVEYLSLDPAMRGWMNAGRSYVPPVQIGEVMRAGAIGHVIETQHPDFKAGDEVFGTLGVQRYAVSDGRGLTPIDTNVAPAPAHLGVLGIGGLTAYFGLLELGRPETGQTVVVSGAAGSVGSVAGQIARIKGCHVVGIAGGEEKCAWLRDELGFDAAIDYKRGDLREQLREHTPDRVDVYFDNVGGDTLDEVLRRLARGARIVICGAISQYNATDAMRGPANYLSLLVNHASMTGFVVTHYADRLAEAARALSGWFAEGKLTARVDIAEGLENFPETLLRLFRGENTGKLVLKIAEE
jgi:NADPH-dependent curcumin reductase CurA